MTEQELESIAKRLLDVIGGGYVTIERKGCEPRKERARAYRIEDEKRLWQRKLFEHKPDPTR